MNTTQKNKKSPITYQSVYRVELLWCNDWSTMFTSPNYCDAKIYAKGLIADYDIASVRLVRDRHVVTVLDIY